LKIMSSIILMDQLHLEIWIQNVVYFWVGMVLLS
jgi:hypothetical protein